MAAKDDSQNVPPDPVKWWRHRRYQSYIGIGGLLAVGTLAVLHPVSDAATDLLGYVGIGCILLIVGYGPGSTLCDALRAWKE